MFRKIQKFKDQKEMQQWYDKQVEGLKRLAQHPDYQQIVEYWKMEYDMIDRKLDGLKGKELEEAVLARSIIVKHLNWIESLTT